MIGLLRLFVAADPGDAVTAGVTHALAAVRLAAPSARWAAADAVPLTLSFLGAVPADQVRMIVAGG